MLAAFTVFHHPMTQALRHTHFHSSRLMRVLAELALLEATQAGGAFAEKLGLWVAFTDAITLHAAHNARPAGAAEMSTPTSARVAAAEAFDRARTALEQALAHSATPKGSKSRNGLPVPSLGLPIVAKSAFEPYRRYYQAQQREMETGVAALRNQVRTALAQASPALQQLAALDAALTGILNERESRLLASIPSLLEKRFSFLLQAHQQRLAHTQQADNPAFWLNPAGWLTRFCHELQTVLQAELDLRLQPALGLVEALTNKPTQSA